MEKEESESQTPKRLSTIIYYVACEYFSAFKKRYYYDSRRELFTFVFLILLVGLQQPASLEVLFKNSAAKTVWVLLLFHYKRTEYDKNKFDWFKKNNP